MSDLYTELLVKKESTAKDALIRYGLFAGTGLMVIAGLLISPILLLAAIALGVVCFFVVPKTDLEYEYLFVNGEMDIDMIMAKTKRKRAFSFDLAEAELAAPLNSHRLDYYNNSQNIKTLDFSSGNPEHRRFAVITRNKETLCKVIIEPDENLAGLMKKAAPGKVFLDT